jgi:glycosyltransferase involved in cell wall biosynthesis
VVGEQMAGPGIRYWELARVLAGHCTVTLAAPGDTSLAGDGFRVHAYNLEDWSSLKAVAEAADVILPAAYVLSHLPQLSEVGVPLAVDGYDPYLVEVLALTSGCPAAEQDGRHRDVLARLMRECLAGDFFMCASERQRTWWLGLLTACGRVNGATYDADPTLRSLVDVVSYGCRTEPPPHTRRVLKGVAPGIEAGDAVLLWGGGIWQWLDPLTLLRAVSQVVARRPDIKLVFPGTRHPNPVVPQMRVGQHAVDLARELDLLDRHVFFGDWVSYADWPNYLLEADVGVSLHLDSLETQLAFRSRILEYVSAGLPMLVTRGDATSEIVARYGLGEVVEYEDDAGVAKAILALLEQPRSAWHDRFETARAELAWDKVAQPLIRFCRNPHLAADRQRHPAAGSGRGLGAGTSFRGILDVLAQRDAEIARLRATVAAYEQGRFIRLMRRVHDGRRSVSQWWTGFRPR